MTTDPTIVTGSPRRARVALPRLAAVLVLATGLVVGWGSTAGAQAFFSVQGIWVDFTPEAGEREDITLRNTRGERVYVQVTLIEEFYEGNDLVRRDVVEDFRTAAVVPTPNRLILPAEARRNVRVLLVKRPEARDRYYSVRLEPVVAGFESDPGPGLNVLVAYEAFVIVRPEDADPRYEITRDGQTLTITNVGDTFVEVTDVRQCDAAGTDCRELGLTKLFPDGRAVYTLPEPGDAVVLIRYGEEVFRSTH